MPVFLLPKMNVGYLLNLVSNLKTSYSKYLLIEANQSARLFPDTFIGQVFDNN